MAQASPTARPDNPHETRPDISPRTSFEALSDDQLHATVRRLTARSNIALADLLVHLGEVEQRGIHRERACASLYTYCIYELRMSEDAAFRRSKAARIARQHPDLRDVLARGELHLTGLLMIAPYLGGERHAEVLERARFRSKREITRLIAELDPRPPVSPRIVPIAPAPPRRPTSAQFAEALAGPVRSLREGDRPEDWMECGATSNCAEEPRAVEPEDPDSGELGELTRAAQALGSPREQQAAQPERPLCYEVRFTAGQEYVDLLEEALDLLGGGRKPDALPKVQLRALRVLVEQLRKRRTGSSAAPERGKRREGDRGDEDRPAPERRDDPKRDATAKADATRTAPEREAKSNATRLAPERRGAKRDDRDNATGPAPERERNDARRDAPRFAPDQAARPTQGRYVPALVRRAVWNRDGSRCAYVDDRGRRCAETSHLELHHQEPYARGGPATVDNLELRCRAHNALAAEQDFGRDYVLWRQGAEPTDD